MNIRKYNPKDLPNLLELFRIVYNEKVYEQAVKRFRWQYEENPYNTSEDPSILVLEVNDKIVGMTGGFAHKLKIGNSFQKAYWASDFMVHPDFRGIHHGLNLAKK